MTDKASSSRAALTEAGDVLNTPRFHYNAGYHDGAQARENGWAPEWQPGAHFSPAYEAAYWQGAYDQACGTYAGNSAEAWARYERQCEMYVRTGVITYAQGLYSDAAPGTYIHVEPGTLIRANLAADRVPA